jgi:taurine dioxygenase
MQIRRLAHALGAEVTGIDLAAPLDDATVARIRVAWMEHIVLVFPGQQLSHQAHIAFSRRMGELELHPLKNFQGAGHPEILEITNRSRDGRRSETAAVGREWHSDGAYTLRPPIGSLLYCREMPDAGGNTWFSNLYVAYETLSDAMKSVVEKLSVVNDLNFYFAASGKARHEERTRERAAVDTPAVVQPLVRTHPETGRKVLFISPAVVREIHGMTRAESEGLLRHLGEHAVRPEFTYRHYWRVGDLLMWDNRCCLHLAPADYDPSQVRTMYRTTLRGEPQGRPLAPP